VRLIAAAGAVVDGSDLDLAARCAGLGRPDLEEAARRVIAAVPDAGVDASVLEQQQRGLDVALVGGEVQRRVAVVVCAVEQPRRADEVEQAPERVRLAAGNGGVEGVVAGGVGHLGGVGALPEQRLDGGGGTVARRDVQLGLLLVVAPVGQIGPVPEQHLHRPLAVLVRRVVQGGVAVGVGQVDQLRPLIQKALYGPCDLFEVRRYL